MDLYSRFLIQFIYAFQHAYRRIETFVFSTSLHHIAPMLKSNDIDEALNSCRLIRAEIGQHQRFGLVFVESSYVYRVCPSKLRHGHRSDRNPCVVACRIFQDVVALAHLLNGLI